MASDPNDFQSGGLLSNLSANLVEIIAVVALVSFVVLVAMAIKRGKL